MFRNRKNQVKLVAGGVGVIVVVVVIATIADKLKKIVGVVDVGFTEIQTGVMTEASVTQLSAQNSAQIAALTLQYQAQVAQYNASYARLDAKREELATLQQQRVEAASSLNSAQAAVDQLDGQRQQWENAIAAKQQAYNEQGTDPWGMAWAFLSFGIQSNIVKGQIAAEIEAAKANLNSIRSQLASAIAKRDAAANILAQIDSKIAAIEDMLGNYAAAFDAIGQVRDGLAIQIQQLGGSV